MSTSDAELKPKKDRSPNHPVITLETALEKAKLLHGKYGRQPAPLMNAVLTMGYKSLYSTSNQAVAALIAYGLANAVGKGDARKVVVTECAERIIRNAPDRDQLLKNAALAPVIHKEVLAHFGGKLPHDDILKNYLLWERPKGSQFTVDAVESFMSRLRDTLKFAKHSAGDNGTDKNSGSGELDTPKNETGDSDDSRGEIKVGSLVQWTSQGADQFPRPLPIARIDEHQGERFAYFEGKGHVPMSQLSLADGSAPTPTPSFPGFTPIAPELPKLAAELDEEKTNLKEGPVILRWPKEISKEGLEDVDDWVQGVLRRARRKAGLDPTGKKS